MMLSMGLKKQLIRDFEVSRLFRSNRNRPRVRRIDRIMRASTRVASLGDNSRLMGVVDNSRSRGVVALVFLFAC